MFLTKYRPNHVNSCLDPDFFSPLLRQWFEPESRGDEAARLPMTNVHETDKDFVLTMEMPGVEKKNVTVNIEDDQIVVTGEKTEKTETEGMLRREIRSEKFRRSFRLGKSIDNDNIKAKLENGVLEVTLPKRAESVGREISVD